MRVQLSPYALRITDERTQPATDGIAHRVTGESFAVSPNLAALLRCLAAEPLDTSEWPRQLHQTLDLLLRHHLLVPPDRPPLDALLDHFVHAVRLNPAVTFARGTQPHLIRLTRSDIRISPRPITPPELTVEPLPPIAAMILALADGSRTLRELRASCATDALFDEAIDWLTHPARQLIKLRPRDLADDQPLRHYDLLTQSFLRSAQPAHPEAASYYASAVSDPHWQFDWVETTLSHAFRLPSAAFAGQTFGHRLADRLEPLLAPAAHPLRILEIGPGLGYLAAEVAAHLRSRRPVATYDLLDLCEPLRSAAHHRLAALGQPSRCFRGHAAEFNLPDSRYDLIVANEVIADLPLAQSQAPAHRFIDRVAAHLNPNGLALVTEFGHPTQPPTRLEHLDHPEYAIAFNDLLTHARSVGLHARCCPLADLLTPDLTTPMLTAQHEHIFCLNRALLDEPSQPASPPPLPFVARSQSEFLTDYAEALARRSIGLLDFRPLHWGYHFGPPFNLFHALVLQRPA